MHFNLLLRTLLPRSYKTPPLKCISPVPVCSLHSLSPGQLSAALLLGEQERACSTSCQLITALCVLHPGWEAPVALKPEQAQAVMQRISVQITGASHPQQGAAYGGYLQWPLCQGAGKQREE